MSFVSPLKSAATTALKIPPSEIQKILQSEYITVEWLAGDGSDRSYFRVYEKSRNTTYVLMQLSESEAEQLKHNRYDWINMAKLLHGHGILVPAVIANLVDFGAVMIEDYGDEMLETRVKNFIQAKRFEDVKSIYCASFETIARLLKIPSEKGALWTSRSFDQDKFIWEFNFFRKKFLESILKWDFSPTEHQLFSNEVQSLSRYLSESSNYFVHRDFHSRNLMIVHEAIAVIDFQDARLGPPSYDVVSLVYDSYVPLEKKLRDIIFAEGLDVLKQCGIASPVISQIQTECKPMLVQRQLKAIGSFGYLTIDKNKGNYLKNVSPALRILREEDVTDARWPFLTKTVLDKMSEQFE